MTIFELFVLAVGLSMDAFAVAVCKGLAIGKIQWKHVVIVGLWFGGFQALMPLIGYLLGSSFAEYIAAVDHWIAMILLVLIGANMVRESLDKDPAHVNPSLGFKTMLVMAIATSIDALAVGVTFAFLEVRILPAISFIGVVTFLLSALGVKIGSIFGTRYKSKAVLAGVQGDTAIARRISVAGYGPDRLINTENPGAAENRRVEIRLVATGDGEE